MTRRLQLIFNKAARRPVPRGRWGGIGAAPNPMTQSDKEEAFRRMAAALTTRTPAAEQEDESQASATPALPPEPR